MPTIKQKKAFNKIIENRGNISKSMREVGYAKATAQNPKNLTDSNGWQELLKEIDDDAIINRFKGIVKKGKDKDSISAGKELLTLKNRYPDKNIGLNLKDDFKDVLE